MRAGTRSRRRLSDRPDRHASGRAPKATTMRIRVRTVCVILGIGLLAAASRAQTTSLPFADIAQPKPGTWPTYHGNLSGNRFSPLDQINTSNVQRPRAEVDVHHSRSAARAAGARRSWSTASCTSPSVNEAFALDARSGREIWHYSRPRTTGPGRRRGQRHQPRRGGARRSRVHGHRQRAPDRAASR